MNLKNNKLCISFFNFKAMNIRSYETLPEKKLKITKVSPCPTDNIIIFTLADA